MVVIEDMLDIAKKVYDDIVNERDAFYKDNLEKLLEARNLFKL